MSNKLQEQNDFEIKFGRLQQRLLAIQLALNNKTLTLDELKIVANMPMAVIAQFTPDYQENNAAHLSGEQELLTKLYKVLNAEEVENLIINDDDLTEILLAFDNFNAEHNEYLSLISMASTSEETLNSNLADFAMLALQFLPFNVQELDNSYTLPHLSLSILKHRWQQWLQTRPSRFMLPQTYQDLARVGLLEKLLTQTLNPHEWLTDNDLQRAVDVYQLGRVTITRFTAQDIGINLHFARQQYHHQQQPYTLPFLLNLGAHHQNIHDTGSHWVSMIVEVDPTQNPPAIKVIYTDSLHLSASQKPIIERVIKQALYYQENMQAMANPDLGTAIYAYPDVKEPVIEITTTNQQRDGYSCGYRALQQVALALHPQDAPENLQALLKADTAEALILEVYTKLLGAAVLSPTQYDNLRSSSVWMDGYLDAWFIPADDSSHRLKDTRIHAYLDFLFSFKGQQKAKYQQLKTTAAAIEAPTHHTIEHLEQEFAAKNSLNKCQALALLDESQKNLVLELNTLVTAVQKEIEQIKDVDVSLIIAVILQKIAANTTLETLKLNGIEPAYIEPLTTYSYLLPSRLEIKCDDEALNELIEALKWRNEYVAEFNLNTAEPWTAIFNHRYLNIQEDKPNRIELDLPSKNYVILKHFFEYLTFHQATITQFFPNTILKLTNLPDAALPFFYAYSAQGMMFKNLELSLTNAQLLADDFKQLLDAKTLESLTVTVTDPLTSESLDALKNSPYFGKIRLTLINAHLPADELIDFYNAQAQAMRKPLKVPPVSQKNNLGSQPLGKIGRALYGPDTLNSLSTEVHQEIKQQVEQEIHQQVEVVNDTSFADEMKEARLETYAEYDNDDALITRKNIATELAKYFEAEPFCTLMGLSPENCWDLLVGEYADYHPQAIHCITRSAALYLLENISHFQFGFHPDNLPTGLYLAQITEQDEEGDDITHTVLAFDPLKPVIGLQDSVLKARIDIGLMPQPWQGDMRQFLNDAQCQALYDQIFSQTLVKPDVNQCIACFFGFDLSKCAQPMHVDVINDLQSLECKKLVLNALLDSLERVDLFEKLENILGENLNIAHLNAFANLIYAGELAACDAFFTELQTLKDNRPNYFKSFIDCFITPSCNWVELVDEASIKALRGLQTFSTNELSWWQHLTDQHTSNAALNNIILQDNAFEIINPHRRFASLSACYESFDYFYSQFKQLSLGLTLPQPFPFTGVYDMHVGLDRLLTILKEARSVEEQLCRLQGVSLQGLGAFYASRYEGFTIVTAEMLLNLGALEVIYEQKPRERAVNNEARFYYEKGHVFRVSDFNSIKTVMEIARWTDDMEQHKSKAKIAVMRYIALFYRRPNYAHLEKVLAHTIAMQLDNDSEQANLCYVLRVFLKFSMGTNQASITQEMMTLFIQQINQKNEALGHALLYACKEIAIGCEGLHLGQLLTINQEILSQSPEVFSAYDSFYEVIKKYATVLKFLPPIGYQTIVSAWVKRIEAQQPLAFIPFIEFLYNQGMTYFPDSATEHNHIVMARCMAAMLVCEPPENTDEYQNQYQAILSSVQTMLNELPRAYISLEQALSRFARLDLVTSPHLPTLEQLNNLMTDIKQQVGEHTYSLSERDINTIVANHLPESVQFEAVEVTAIAHKDSGDLLATMNGQIDEIIKKINDFVANPPFPFTSFKEAIKKQVDELFGPECQLLRQYGPSQLMTMLGKLQQESNPVATLIKNNLMPIMQDVFDTHVNNLTKALHAQELFTTLPHPLKKLEFDEFINAFAEEINHVTALMNVLSELHNKRPSQYEDIFNAILKHSNIKNLNASILFNLLSPLVKGLSIHEAFPLEMLLTMLTNSHDEKVFASNLAFFQKLLPDNQNIYELSSAQCASLYNLFVVQPSNLSDLSKLLEIKKHRTLTFDALLILLPKSKQSLSDMLTAYQTLSTYLPDAENSAQLIQSIIELCSEKYPDDFISFVNFLSGINPLPDAKALELIINSAKKEAISFENLKTLVNQAANPRDAQTLITLLNQAPKPPLDEIVRAYQTYNSTKAINALLVRYDCDPYGYRAADQTLNNRLFDTTQFADLVNQLGDLSHNGHQKQLPDEAREQLLRWLVYVNGCGHTPCITTIEGEAKAVKDMSFTEINQIAQTYRKAFSQNSFSPEDALLYKLHYIALMREVMYRTTTKAPKNDKARPGRHAHPTQLLYVLLSMQQGSCNFVGQIKTGEGKSLVAAMSAALYCLEGHTVDIATSRMDLAHEGLGKHQAFFNYLDIKTQRITQNSPATAYQPGGIHYSTLSEFALFRSEMMSTGHASLFNAKSLIIADEIDFLTLDDDTRYRKATLLDKPLPPFESPFLWAYDALIDFVDNQPLGIHKSETQLLEESRQVLERNSKNLPPAQLKLFNELKANPALYEQRLTTWLTAAIDTKKIINREGIVFKLVKLNKTIQGQEQTITKACRLVNNEPQLQAQFSDARQQFLHARLRKKYKDQDHIFLVEPETACISSRNAHIMLKHYNRILGMSGTVGSPAEIMEQSRYFDDLHFFNIPTFKPNARVDLPPRFTQAAYLDKPKEEERAHIALIVNDILRHLKAQKDLCPPVLVNVRTEAQGQAIARALEEKLEIKKYRYLKKRLHIKGIQQFYASTHPDETTRLEEAKEARKLAGKSGIITFSTVMGRGTDIEPTNKKGLYVIQTSIDTKPNAEGLDRATRQVLGRAARQGHYGTTRFVVKRSEFSEAYSEKSRQQLRQLPQTMPALKQAVLKLGVIRFRAQQSARGVRNRQDNLQYQFTAQYEQYAPFIQQLPEASQTAIKATFSEFLDEFAQQWPEVPNEDSLARFRENINTVWQTTETTIRSFFTNSTASSALPQPLLFEKTTAITLNPQSQKPSKAARSTQGTSPVKPIDTITAIFQVNPKAISLSTALKEINAIARAYPRLNLETLTEQNHEARLPDLLQYLLQIRYRQFMRGNFKGDSTVNEHLKALYHLLLSTNFTTQEVHSRHYQLVCDAKHASVQKQSHYLLSFMNFIHEQRFEETQTWLKGQSQPSLARFTDALKHYQHRWWTRAYVSEDRKKVVDTLLKTLEENASTSEERLNAIRAARQTLLKDDRTHKRAITAGTRGRLFQFLNNLRDYVEATHEINTATLFGQHIEEITTVLETGFSPRLRNNNPFNIRQLISDLKSDVKSDAEKYRALTSFNTKIKNKLAAHKSTKHPVLITELARYIEHTHIHLTALCQAGDTDYRAYPNKSRFFSRSVPTSEKATGVTPISNNGGKQV